MICANGLVDILDNKTSEDITNKFRLMDPIPVKTVDNIRCEEIGNVEGSPLSRAFFSNANINIIHNSIIRGVYDKTGKVIPRQDTNHLLGIMRSIYMEGCRDEFMTRHIPSQNISDRETIVKLNDIVVTKSVNLIKNELVAYYKYREDISTMAVPQDLPILSNMRNKTLELKPWF